MAGRVLVVAGSDSSGGAGIQADIRVITALGGYAATAVTALTAQNTLGVFGVTEVPADFVAQQMELTLTDIGVDIIKTGMLHNRDIVDTVATVLKRHAPNIPRVVDPVLISGSGSNLQALLEATQDAYEIALVVSNVPGAGGLERAQQAGVEAIALDHKPYGKNREAFERDLDALLVERNIEIIALAGFMRVLTPWFVNAWAGRLINIHPSLLPKYRAPSSINWPLIRGDTKTGLTIDRKSVV